MNVEYVDTETVMCEDDHPRVYFSLKDGEAICGYCNKKFTFKEKDDGNNKGTEKKITEWNE